ncbi:MAG: hypothetical protein U9R08_04900 [Nanoarchaeota archaeon]|nr:hypothetical protein [Nanoarchaeota archaeon]
MTKKNIKKPVKKDSTDSKIIDNYPNSTYDCFNVYRATDTRPGQDVYFLEGHRGKSFDFGTALCDETKKGWEEIKSVAPSHAGNDQAALTQKELVGYIARNYVRGGSPIIYTEKSQIHPERMFGSAHGKYVFKRVSTFELEDLVESVSKTLQG